jgi:hypothetical protein
LELVIVRLVELKHKLVKTNPPHYTLKMEDEQGREVMFPWEYVHLDEVLVDLKLSPDILEIPIPKYFKEDNQRQLSERDRIVAGYMRNQHNTEFIYLENDVDMVSTEKMTLDKAIEVIQRNERGRQGLDRARLVRDLRDRERQGRMYDSSAADVEMDVEVAATNLQRVWKGSQSRVAAHLERDNELMFVGMRPRKDNVEKLNYEKNVAYHKRKQEQIENKLGYEQALDDLKAVIMDEEGPEKKEELREERTLWITDQIAQEKFPDDLHEFYEKPVVVEEAAADAKGGKDDKKGGKKEEAKGKDAKGKGKGKDKGAAEAVEDEVFQLQGKTATTIAMYDSLLSFEDTWETRDESDNFQQKYDVSLAKQVVRPGVYLELRKQVDDMLLMNLQKIQLQIAPGGGKKGKKGKKDKKKKGKKDKKGKGEKALVLLGDKKLPEFKGMDTERLLSMLVEYGLVVKTRGKCIKDFVGDFDYLGKMHRDAVIEGKKCLCNLLITALMS